MSMSEYQAVVWPHLIELFKRGDLITDQVVIYVENEEFRRMIVELAVEHSYIPIFFEGACKHMIISFIKQFRPC